MKEKTANRTRPTACCTVADPGSLDAATLASYAELLNALADPTRLGIINLLANNDEPVCVCDITAQFDKGQPTISHHLSILREAGLVSGTREGIWSYYTLNRERMAQLQSMLADIYSRGAALPLMAARPAMQQNRGGLDEQPTAPHPRPLHRQLRPQPDGRRSVPRPGR